MLLSKIIRTNLINKLDILPKLSASNLSGQVMDLKSVVASLNELYPLKNACDWDNVGLLLEPSKEKPIKNILLTNDLTEKVMDEAIEKHTDLIISYHPPLFRSFKRITCADWKERNIIRCLENRIAVYSPHTAVDAQIGGVNDWLLSPWQQWENYKPIEESCAEDNNAGNVGMGRIGSLVSPTTIREAIEEVKKLVNLDHLRLALAPGHTLDTPITTIATCAGSGSSVLIKASSEADLMITGEMSHHEALDLVHRKASVILCEHSNTERGFLQILKKQLEEKLTFGDGVNVVVSEADKDPMIII